MFTASDSFPPDTMSPGLRSRKSPGQKKEKGERCRIALKAKYTGWCLPPW